MPDYFVQLPGDEPMMVRAANQAQALRHATRERVTIRTLTIDDAVTLGKAGKVIIDATGEQAEVEAEMAEVAEGLVSGALGEKPPTELVGAAGKAAREKAQTE